MNFENLNSNIIQIIATNDQICNAILVNKMENRLSELVIARGTKMMTIDNAFDELAAALQFPYYFRNNWAALDECLNDSNWMPLNKCVLIISDFNKLFCKENNSKLSIDILKEIMFKASNDWKNGVNGRILNFSCVLAVQEADTAES